MKNLEYYLNKKVKIISISDRKYIGKVTGIVTAQDNEPEIDELSILNELDNRNYSLFENEIKSINIISNWNRDIRMWKY